MQIHELNNFTGTLGSGAYLAIDDGTDTGKISSQELLAATEARIDNIIAGPAPSAEEIVDARLGADGVTYPSLGDAIRDQFTDVKSNLTANGIASIITDWINGHRITNNGASLGEATTKTGWRYFKITCTAGDKFTINVDTNNTVSYRPWAFVDNSNNILTVGARSGIVSNLTITAPTNSAYLVVNDMDSGGLCFRGQLFDNISLLYRGICASDLNSVIKQGWYNIPNGATHLPLDYTGIVGLLKVYNPGINTTVVYQEITSAQPSTPTYHRYISNDGLGTTTSQWVRDIGSRDDLSSTFPVLQYKGDCATDLDSVVDRGYYRIPNSATNLPSDIPQNQAATLLVFSPALTTAFAYQIIFSAQPDTPIFHRYVSIDGLGTQKSQWVRELNAKTGVNVCSALYGKTLVCDGDSICAGVADQPENKGAYYGRLVSAFNNTGHNYAVGGGTITAELYYSDSSPRHWISRSIDNIYSNYPTIDYLILEGGTNDADLIGAWSGDTPPAGWGSWSTSDYSGSYDDTTFCGAVESLFYKALNYYPNAKIGFIVAMEMGSSLAKNRKRYFDEIVKIAKKWHIPVLNLWENFPADSRISSFYDSSMTPEQNIEAGHFYKDGQHPTSYGYNRMQNAIQKWVESL